MDQETTDNKDNIVGGFSVKISCREGKSKTLPSPARFLELQGIKDKEDIVTITRCTLTGQHYVIDNLLKEGYNKSEDEIKFIRTTYSDLIFKFVLLSVEY